MVGYINGAYVIDVDFREGNEAPVSKNLEFIKQCQAQLPLEVKFNRFRADSASYQADIFNYCEKEDILFTVTAKMQKTHQSGHPSRFDPASYDGVDPASLVT